MAGRGSALGAWLPVGIWLAVIFGLSSLPNLRPPDVGLPLPDKIAHLGEYAILGALLGRARGSRGPGWRAALTGALLGLVIGTLDELYQRGTPGRESGAADALADTLGAALGFWVYTRFAARRRRRRDASSV
jgi:VanZ family protein